MSRSYRRPYVAVTGRGSAHEDKTLAARGARRAQNRAIFECQDWDELMIPDRRACNFNNVWSWSRDGKQLLQRPPLPPDEHHFVVRWIVGSPDDRIKRLEHRYLRRLKQYRKLCRK